VCVCVCARACARAHACMYMCICVAIITPQEIEIGASSYDCSFRMIMWCGVPNNKIWPLDQWNTPHYIIP
jgi:hypothetical protein